MDPSAAAYANDIRIIKCVIRNQTTYRGRTRTGCAGSRRLNAVKLVVDNDFSKKTFLNF